jgi:hypothetical protein
MARVKERSHSAFSLVLNKLKKQTQKKNNATSDFAWLQRTLQSLEWRVQIYMVIEAFPEEKFPDSNNILGWISMTYL